MQDMLLAAMRRLVDALAAQVDAGGPFAPGFRAVLKVELKPVENTLRRLLEVEKTLGLLLAAEEQASPDTMFEVSGRLHCGDMARRHLPKYGVSKATVARLAGVWGAAEPITVLDAHVVYLGPRKAEWIGSTFLDRCEVVVRSEAWGGQRATNPPQTWVVY